MPIGVKSVYEELGAEDGYRVLVDEYWPQHKSKSRLKIDAWMKEIAPSEAARRWWGHRPARWEEFRDRYRRELTQPHRQALVDELVRRARRGPVTLVLGRRETQLSNATVIAEVVQEQLP
jgi:uncharacterized protein YeaO (DUF488 family)